jgi:hypothetical protein
VEKTCARPPVVHCPLSIVHHVPCRFQ